MVEEKEAPVKYEKIELVPVVIDANQQVDNILSGAESMSFDAIGNAGIEFANETILLNDAIYDYYITYDISIDVYQSEFGNYNGGCSRWDSDPFWVVPH